MAEGIRQQLAQLIIRHGPALHEDRRQCEELLRDLKPDCRRETFVLIAAVKEGIVRDLLNSSSGVSAPVLVERLTRRLREHVGLAEEGANWAVDAWAEALRVGPYQSTLPYRLTNSIGIEFIQVPAGEFSMGSPDQDVSSKENEKPCHRVRITKPFFLATCPVTQTQYRAVIGSNPSWFSPTGDGKYSVGANDTGMLPVEMVSWQGAELFCRRLGQFTEERLASRAYRLPSEAEWEYACRAGTTTRYFFGDEPVELANYAWSKLNSGQRPHSVGQKKPNAMGLYDMLGNVNEWCRDPYDADYYRHSPIDDPLALDDCSHRVSRGGGWYHDASVCRCASRIQLAATQRNRMTGFRLVCIP